MQFHFHTNCTSSNLCKLHQNFDSPLCLCQEWGQAGFLILLLALLSNKKKIHAVWFQFCPSSEDRANFPFVCPPLNVEAVLASVLWEEKEKWLLRIGRYKGHRRPLGIGQPLKSWGRLMLVHNSFKHHLEVETWFPVDTHRQSAYLQEISSFNSEASLEENENKVWNIQKCTQCFSFKLGFDFDNPSLICSYVELEHYNKI